VLNSLANWGHGANLEALVRIVRLTRPDVVITWLPGIFIGENHGDHQAAGVLATEAFDLANDPAAFPAQVAGATKPLEVYLENLTPWQPKKLYFFSDADDQKQFDGTGPAYSVKEISPSQKKTYWRLALDAATPHLTQFPAEIHQLVAMSDEQLNKFMEDPQHMWWTEPMTLILGKAAIQTTVTDDVFSNLSAPLVPSTHTLETLRSATRSEESWLTLGGPWFFYNAFRNAHGLGPRKTAQTPEIGIKAGSSLLVPIVIGNANGKALELKVEVGVPAGWKVVRGDGIVRLPAERRSDLYVEVATPDMSAEELKKSAAQEVIVRALVAGKSVGEVHLEVKLRASALAQ